MSLVGFVFCISCMLSLLLVPFVARLCRAGGLVDHPDGHRKLHAEPAALGGGIAAFVVVCLVVAGAAAWNVKLADALARDSSSLLGLFGAAFVLLVTGIADDAVGLRGRQKLAGQILASGVLMAWGLVIERVQLFGTVVDLGLLSVPITLLWLLGAINAVNLLDGINGLAATVGITGAAALAIMSQIGGHVVEAVIAAALAGSLLGFLRYNFPRASVFLGDAGSMLIGLVIGALSVEASLKGPGTVLLATPVCLMSIPFFDSAAAILRRKLTGRSIFSTDRAHLHHCLTDQFGSLAAVGVVALACIISAVAAVSSLWWKNEIVALVSATAMIVFFIASRIFGHSELRLLAARIHSLAASLVTVRHQPRRNSKQSSVRLQGNRKWDLLWATLTQAADDFPLQRLELDVNAPSLREGYHAKWESAAHAGEEKLWRFEMPLMAVGHKVGHIRITAERTSESAVFEVERLLAMLDDFESRLGRMLTDVTVTLPEAGAAAAVPAPLARTTLGGASVPAGSVLSR